MGTGNIYGLVGMAMYGYLRNLVFTLMVPVFLYYLVGFLYSKWQLAGQERLLGMTNHLLPAASVLFVPAAFGNCFIPERCHVYALSWTGSQSTYPKVADSVILASTWG